MAGLGAGLLSPTAPARVGGGCQLCDTVLSQGTRNALVDLVQEPQHCMWEGL